MSGQIASQMLRDTRPKGGVRMVLLALAVRANGDRCCWPSMEQLKADTQMTDRGIQQAIGSLKDMGLLTVERGGGRGVVNRYHLQQPIIDTNPEPATPFPAENPEPETPNGVIHQSENPERSSINPEISDRNPERSSINPEPRSGGIRQESSIESSKNRQSGGARSRASPRGLTDPERQKLIADFTVSLGGQEAVGEHIADALAHSAAKKWNDTERYVRNWLRREAERYGARTNGRARANSDRATAHHPEPGSRGPGAFDAYR